MPPLGLLSIGAVLEREGIPVEIVPANVLGLDWRGIEDKIRRDKPDIVGVTITTENRFQSFRLIRLAKKAHPGALTVLGGPHASMAAEDCLAHIPEIDIVVRGEGELTMLDVCRAWEPARSSPRSATSPASSCAREAGSAARRRGPRSPTSTPSPSPPSISSRSKNIISPFPSPGTASSRPSTS